jgi:hypothetical protein
MFRLVNDVIMAIEFFNAMRNTRRQYPSKNLFQQIDFVCEILRQANVKAQTLYAMKHGPIRVRERKIS